VWRNHQRLNRSSASSTPSRVAVEGSAVPGGLKGGVEVQRVDAFLCLACVGKFSPGAGRDFRCRGVESHVAHESSGWLLNRVVIHVVEEGVCTPAIIWLCPHMTPLLCGASVLGARRKRGALRLSVTLLVLSLSLKVALSSVEDGRAS